MLTAWEALVAAVKACRRWTGLLTCSSTFCVPSVYQFNEGDAFLTDQYACQFHVGVFTMTEGMTDLNAHDSTREKRAVVIAFCCRLGCPGGKDDIGGEWKKTAFQLSFDAMGQAWAMMWPGIVDRVGRSQTLVLHETTEGAVIVVLVCQSTLDGLICGDLKSCERV